MTFSLILGAIGLAAILWNKKIAQWMYSHLQSPWTKIFARSGIQESFQKRMIVINRIGLLIMGSILFAMTLIDLMPNRIQP